MRLAIIGYGNLGKSLEQAIEKSRDLELAAVYSRRSLDNEKYRPLANIEKDDDFDAALIAWGSYADARQYAKLLAKFDTVDSFDTHAVIDDYKRELNELNSERIAIVGTGWDPGLLSLMRGVISGENEVVTVWGKGISQGHSNALRSIKGVIDAIQFTEPKAEFQKLIEQGVCDSKKLHKRMCYVACVERDKEQIEKQIVNMPNYFEGYEVIVKFVTPSEVRQLKLDTSHAGRVFCCGNGYKAYASIELDCNTELTAQVMLNYARALPQLKKDGYCGALDVFDIPMKYVARRELI